MSARLVRSKLFIVARAEREEAEQKLLCAGATRTTSRLRQDYRQIIVAVKKRQGAMIHAPPPGTVKESGDILIALDRRSQMKALASGRG